MKAELNFTFHLTCTVTAVLAIKLLAISEASTLSCSDTLSSSYEDPAVACLIAMLCGVSLALAVQSRS